MSKKVDVNDLNDDEFRAFVGGVDSTPPLDRAALLGDLVRPAELMAVNPNDDPDCLLGNRWICRGGSCVWTGPTGAGKSALLMQAGYLWAVGKAFFGIQAVRPLKSVVFQAENDRFDIAEQGQGVTRGLNLFEHLNAINANFYIYTEREKRDAELFKFIRDVAELLRPDLVWIDPLKAYISGSISDDSVVTPFIRQGLDPIAKEFGFAYMINHHIAKPGKMDNLSNWTTSDYAYAGIGSSDLSNWMRAGMHLKKTDERRYDLMATKRGSRAGLRPPPHVDAFKNETPQEPTDSIPIEWAPDGIYWVSSGFTADIDPEMTNEEFIECLSKSEWWGKDQIANAISKAHKKAGKRLSRDKARLEFDNFISRHDVSISKQDGQVTFKGFLARVGGASNQGTLQLRKT